MIARHLVAFLALPAVAALGLSAAVLGASAVPTASAQPCPDVDVVFARGTDDPPGLGPTGQAFVDSLRPRVGEKSMEVYPVNYPATQEWSTGVDGINDTAAHVVSMAGSCPDTKLVLSGYSQGAAVMGFVTSSAVPDGVDPATVPKPMDPGVADHVAAVVLFATPNSRAMNFLKQPEVVIGPLYQAKTIQVCAPEDPVCSDGMNLSAHVSYQHGGSIVDQAAAFAVDHLPATSGAPQEGNGTAQTVGSSSGGFGSE